MKDLESARVSRTFVSGLRLVLLTIVATAFCEVAAQTEKVKKPDGLSEGTTAKIANRMSNAKSGSIVVFDSEGNFKREDGKVSDEDRKRFDSLQKLLVKNPIDSCKNPQASKQLPEQLNDCVICDDGSVVCSQAKFSPQGKAPKKPQMTDKYK